VWGARGTGTHGKRLALLRVQALASESDLLGLRIAPEGWSVSWTTHNGCIDPRTGRRQFIYSVCVTSNPGAEYEDARHDGKIVASEPVPYLPDAPATVRMLKAAMINPQLQAGPPRRPQHVLIAHRFGAEAYEQIASALMQLGIMGKFEDAQSALISAAEHDMSPDGFNFDRLVVESPRVCAACGKQEEQRKQLRRCGACGEVLYCSHECSQWHWREGHKRVCRSNAANTRDERDDS